MRKILLLLMVSISMSSLGQGFLHRNGQNIVNGNGENVLLRGLGLGGWMVQEGYMLQTESFASPQHKIKQKIVDLIGTANTEEFYQAYRANGITKRDIDSLKAWGFNSVRLPMHYNLYTLPIEQETVAGQNTWLDEGFTMTDNLLSWCAANNMYLILDLHATPGGQGKDAAISDYDDTKPSLWESAANRDKMVALWQKLALRYKDNPWIGAYDIINEPNWNFTGTNQNGCDENSNAPLKALMVSITQAIRQVDNNHMIIIEGNCWGNNYNGIFPLWDDNMALSFHKYWNYNNTGSIQTMLNYRTQYNVPIWLGESGENSNVWFKDAISLMESNNIGWAFWPMKKVESIAGVTSVTKNAGYEQLLQYWKNGGTQPTQTAAKAALMQLAENFKMQNVTIKPDVKDAMFRQITTTATKNYKNHPLPGKVYATEYDLGQNGFAYFDKDIANYKTDTGTYADWNKGWSMRNDGVDIGACNDNTTNGFQVGYIENTEWLLYTLNLTAAKAYDIDIRYATPSSGKIYLEDANGKISETITLPSTGAYNTWGTVTLTDVVLKQGTNKIKVYFEKGDFNLNFLEFKNERNPSAVGVKTIDASTTVLGDKINLTFNKNLQAGIAFIPANFQLTVNGTPTVITTVAFKPSSLKTIILKATTAINPNDVITLTYNGTNIIADDTTVQAAFTNIPVKNNVGNLIGISGTIQAEDFFFNSGLTIETTNDTGAGSHAGYTDNGDYLDYLVNITESGNYKIEYRTSGESATGKIKLQLINEDTTIDIPEIAINPTNSWTSWATTVSQAVLPAGRYIARFTVVNSGFNLNWIKFTQVLPDDDNDNVSNINDLCPNTAAGDVVDFNGCTLFSLASNNFTLKATGESCRSSNNGSIDITSVANQPFLATISGAANLSNNFTTTTSFANLAAGTYSVCITIPTIPSFKRCFDITIQEPADLAASSRVAAESYKLTVDLEGGSIYRIDLNGTLYMTDKNSITLNLKPGKNDLVVKTDKECQGTYKQSFVLEDNIFAYPNPIKEHMLYITVPAQQNELLSLQVISMVGKLVIERQLTAQDNTIGLDVTTLASGNYILKVVSNTSIYNSKFIRL